MGLIRVLMFAMAALVAYVIYQKITGSVRRKESPEQGDQRLESLVQDPQCGIYVDSREAYKQKTNEGLLHFCGKDCAKAYLSGEKSDDKAKDKTEAKPEDTLN